MNRFLVCLREVLHQGAHRWQCLLKSGIIVIDVANTTDSLKLECWFKIRMRILEAKVVIESILQLFLVLLVGVVQVLEHVLVLRLALYKFEEGSERLSILISLNVEVKAL